MATVICASQAYSIEQTTSIACMGRKKKLALRIFAPQTKLCELLCTASERVAMSALLFQSINIKCLFFFFQLIMLVVQLWNMANEKCPFDGAANAFHWFAIKIVCVRVFDFLSVA